MCNKIYDFKLCICLDNNEPIHHNKKTRRNKYKSDQIESVEYVWCLLRFIEKTNSREMGRVIMPSSNIGEGLTEDFVLNKLNESNCFDFDYLPRENDSLSLQIKGRFDIYLAYTFENGKWIIGTNYDAFNDVLENIGEGKLKKIYTVDDNV